MANNQQAVEPVQGQPAPAPAGPAPIPPRQMRFRTAAQPGAAIPAVVPAFPVATALPPLLAHAEGYSASEVPRSGLNTVLPSYINICVRTYFTNQKLAVNDKFLKEVTMYHPDALDLFNSFLFVYHTLRVRNQVGQLSVHESTLLSDMLREYPPSSLPVPGTIADALQSISTTENPYPWLGNITTTLPEVTDFRSPSHAYNLDHNRHIVWPNFKFLMSQLVATAARARPTDNTWANLAGVRFTSPGSATGNITAPAALRTNSPERFWLQTPHGRIPSILNLRVAQAFHDSVSGSANAPFYSQFALDLPSLNVVTATNTNNLTTYIGLIDDEGVTNRVMRYRRWPTQLATMVATACKYITGSRHLSDIPITGLGAMHHISRFTASARFEVRDPHTVQANVEHAAIAATTYAAFHMTTLDAILHVRDPVSSRLSIQYQMLAQTNISLEEAEDTQGAPLGPGFVQLRNGPFWEYPIAEFGPEAAVANTIMSHLPNFIRSNPRRDASE